VVILELHLEQPVLQSVIDGHQDEKLVAIAKVLRNHRGPVFLRFAHEMNGNWYPWSGVHNGGGAVTLNGPVSDGPLRYRLAWRHVWHLFDDVGAKNVVWVWNVNPVSWPSEDWNEPDKYYPGDEYVDWTGMTLYGAYWGDYGARTMIPLLYYDHPEKPMMLTEVSVADEKNYYVGLVDPHAKLNYTRESWLNEFFGALEQDFPRVNAFLWFNEYKEIDTEADWRLTADPYPETLQQFRSRIQNERYLSEVK
jgi:beta-mannanase